jgi:hypothetical protein
VSDQVFCPECGAPAPFRGTAVSVVCEYCDSTIVRTGADLRLVGKVSAIVDNGSPILLDTNGKFDNLPFRIAGRLQVRYQRGTWNEWFLEFADGTVGWLADALGSYAITKPRDKSIVAGRVPTCSQLSGGMTLSIDGRMATVVDARGADYVGAEGMLPFEAEPGIKFYSADLRGPDGSFHTLDYGGNPDHQQPELYTGHAVKLQDLSLSSMRHFQGWRRG